MYNRYIPQPDGSYRRNRIPDTPPSNHPPMPPMHQHPQHPPEECPPPEPEPCEVEQQPCSPPPPKCRRVRKPRPSPPGHHREPPCCAKQDSCADGMDNSVGGFLRQLLPKNFDTGDLLIVLLLLLMSGDCAEDKNNALLTLALYLFM